MPNDFVTIKGKKSYTRDDTLFLFNKGITDIAEIEGLEDLTNIRTLKLGDNQIKETKGLEHLTNLQELLRNQNQIREIRGLENLEKLQMNSLGIIQ
ncbi:MAG: leucine-rich repeat domain-containing protein [Promethearchaeota archaeon]